MSLNHDHGGNIFAIARSLGVAPEEAIDFSASINPLGLSATVRAALVAGLDRLVHYPDTTCTALKTQLAQSHNLSTDHVAVSNGSTELIYKLPALLPGKRAVVVSPAFSEYSHALKQHNWDVRHLLLSPREQFRLSAEAVKAELSRGCDALYLCNPGNPSGMLYPSDLIGEIFQICRDAGAFMVLDEAFMDFCEEHSAKQAITKAPNGLVLRSMTKFFAIPGLRLGYALAHPELIRKIESIDGPWNVNTLAQLAGVAALQDGDYRARTLQYVQQERERLAVRIAQFPHLKVHASRVNYLLCETDGAITSEQIQTRLLRERILIRDCANFIGLSNRFFRIAVRTAAENDRLVHSLNAILK